MIMQCCAFSGNIHNPQEIANNSARDVLRHVRGALHVMSRVVFGALLRRTCTGDATAKKIMNLRMPRPLRAT